MNMPGVSEVLTIYRYETRQLLKRHQILYMIVLWIALMVGMPLYVFTRVFETLASMELGASMPEDVMGQFFCDVYVSRYPFIIMVLAASSLLSESFFREKLVRTVESLLATHVRPVEVLLGKVLAAFVVSLGLALTVVVLFLLGLNLVLDGGLFLPSGMGWVNALVLAPTLGLLFFVLMGMLELITNHSRLLNVVMFFLSFGMLYFSTSDISSDGVSLHSSAPQLAGVFALAIVALAVAVACIGRRLTAERIVLSC